MNKVFRIVSFFSLLIFIGCTDDSDDLFLSKLDGKSFKSIEAEMPIDGEILIRIDKTLLNLYTRQDQDCWKLEPFVFRAIDNYEFNANFEDTAGNGGIMIVSKREEGGVEITWYNTYYAIRGSINCLD
jgi:hypothetical protein